MEIPLQQVDYSYNIRGWMTQINDPNNLAGDLFGYKIRYNQVEGLETPDTSDTGLKVLPRYNGNIAEVDWKTAAQANESLKTYGYVYDDMNRLSAGFYQDSTNPSLREYYEKVTYDSNGNIMSMKRTAQRMGATALLIDNLTYQYEGGNSSNRLQKVTETIPLGFGYPYKATPTDITYDDNGNITSYQDKGISSIQYNYLNLPKQVTRNSVVTDYTYRADGVKVKKLFGTTETHYVDGFQYKSEGSAIQMVIIPTSQGYYDAQRDAYFYNFTDHLGNVRLSYSDADGNGVVTGDIMVQECSGGNCNSYIIPGEMEGMSNYYPFGMLLENHNNQANSSNAYKYKYNGKELQETGMYDYGARFYMPDIGRWGVVDPLAEISRRFSPYVYGNNNPVRFTDPDGRSAETFTGDDAQNAYWHFYFGGSVNNFNGTHTFGGSSGNQNSMTPAHHYIDPGGSGGGGSGGSSLSSWMQSYLGGGSNVGGGFNISQYNSDEEPVNFFSKSEPRVFQKTFEEAINRFSNTKGDGIFRVFGHGTAGYMMDGGQPIVTADQFDTQMSKKNDNWKNVNHMPQSTLILYVCLSATEINGETSIARKISQQHPNTLVIGFDGYVSYGSETITHQGTIKTINKAINYSDNLGAVVFYKNGIESNRMLYNQFKLLQSKAHPTSGGL